MKISNCKILCENTFFPAALAAFFGYGAGWLPLAFPLLLFAASLLLVFSARLHAGVAAISPPGMIPLLLFAGLPLVQLIPLPPLILKCISPGTWRLYGETIWLAVPGVWMPVSLYPKATLDVFFFLSLNVAVYLVTANLLRERRKVEKVVATLTVFAVIMVMIVALLEIYPPLSAASQVRADLPAGPAESSVMPKPHALLVTLFPLLMLFAGYRYSLLRHYPLREKIGDIFGRTSLGFTGLGTTTVSLLLLCIYITFRFAPVAFFISAAALLFCGFQLFLKRRRRALSQPAFIAAFFFCLAAVLAGNPAAQNKHVEPESDAQPGMELRLLSEANVAAKFLSDFPVLGTGVGTGPMVRSRLEESGGDVTARAEIADPVDGVVGSGLVGVFLAGWFLLAFLWRVAGRREVQKGRREDCLLAGSFGGLLAVVILFVPGMLPIPVGLWTFFLAGLAVAATSLQGIQGCPVDGAARITPRVLKASTVIALLVVGTCSFSALGSEVGKIICLEAWQLRDRREDNNSVPAAVTSRGAWTAGMLDPLEGRYPFAQGGLWMASGNFSTARKKFAAALERDPLNGQYLQALGELQAREGDRAKGERLILAGLRDRAALAERQEFYARWLAASARTEEAMQVMREGLTRAPGQSRSFLQMMVLEGIPLRKLRQALPDRSRCFLDYADYQWESGDRHGARKSYQFALDLVIGEMDADPSDFWRLYRYFSSEGNDEAALTALQAGLRLYPHHSEFRRLSAEAYRRLGIDFRAAEEYRKTLLYDPDNKKAKQGLEELTAD